MSHATRCGGESHFTRPWLRLVAGGLMMLALGVVAVGPKALAAPADQDTPKKEEPPAKEPRKGDADDLRKDVDQLRADLEKMREEMRKHMEEFRRQFPGRVPLPDIPFGRLGRPQDGRLGVMVDRPGDALVDQLGLTKGKGLIIQDVRPDSAADKAGLKNHDVIVEFNGKPVPDDAREFARMVDEVKANTPVDAVVVRKGQQQTVKGITLPESRRAETPPPVRPH
jgi:membrane-associated protease RseP (regulator of RpoE activity)